MRIGAKLRKANDNTVLFWCPGCRAYHAVGFGEGTGPRWSWNENADKPTFTPSVMITYPAVPDAVAGMEEWKNERICHSFITDGMIQYLDDSTHMFKGQTLELPDLPH